MADGANICTDSEDFAAPRRDWSGAEKLPGSGSRAARASAYEDGVAACRPAEEVYEGSLDLLAAWG